MLGLLILGGFVTIFLSSKNWHWTQLVLVLFTFFAAIGFLFLGAETLRIHQTLRKGLPRLEKQIADAESQIDTLKNGSNNQPGILELAHRLRIVTRERGRVWRGAMPAGQVDQQGRVAIEITKPAPHGLVKDTIVYVFEAGNPNAADPPSGRQYLGELRVIDVQEGGATLEPVLLIDDRTGQRLAASEGPWSLYETMPIDRHRLFANIPPERLQEMLPAESLEEYLRHGTEATDDDDQWHIAGFDENGQRVGPENMDSAVKKLYDRSLRDYAFLFNELSVEKVVALAQQDAVAADIARLTQAQTNAEATGKFRQEQIKALNRDLSGMRRDLAAIESHRDQVQQRLDYYQGLVESYLKANSDLAKRFTEHQHRMAERINSIAPAPTTTIFANQP